jgi:hypothetical protein
MEAQLYSLMADLGGMELPLRTATRMAPLRKGFDE